MDEMSMVRILQTTRHDLMNNLQVIQGYLSMDKIDVVKKKLAECIDYYDQERKLININAPHFILWVIQFNHRHENIQLIYHIEGESLDLGKVDQLLVKDSDYVVNMINKLGSKMELYEIKLELIKVSKSKVKLSFTIVGQCEWINDYKNNEQNKSICVKESDDDIIYELLYTIE